MKQLVIFMAVVILASLLLIPKRQQQQTAYKVWLNDDNGNKYYGYEKDGVLHVNDEDGQNYTFQFGDNGKIYRIDADTGTKTRFNALVTDSYKKMKGYGA
ncbi:MAG: hypothetical protein GY858_00945 [Candidatus Omnitrophica bacterium]|nr:hypothetical protein [Candidatus Omnitrophota bacterium]